MRKHRPISLKKAVVFGLICTAQMIAVTGTAISQAARLEATVPDLRTPAAPASPHINGPKLYGTKPGHSFLYRVPCTGTRPIRFSSKGLPASMKLDPATGIISGQSPEKNGEYVVTISARNAAGAISRSFRIVVGDTLGLTPQMGWNDWYTFYDRVTDRDIRGAAQAMISSGMADYGYQFVDIDDAWERKPGATDHELSGPTRDASGSILSNARFPDMPALTRYVHSLGLKTGIYSSPGPLTCAKFEASYGHEAEDAAQFAKWGFDLLKYDMCSYRSLLKDKSLPELQAPYVKMGALISSVDRDMVLNMCQYGMGEVWKWGRSVGGTSWRTTGDLGLAKDESLPGFYSIGLANAALDRYAGPGGWNDPDYIIIGVAGDAHHTGLAPRSTRLTHDEQYSYMSMWSLMAAPLFFSGDMTRLDAFTLNILNNSEVIDVDQDSLGKQARMIRHSADEFVLAKPLEDGSLAVGLFNTSSSPREITLDLKEVGLSGSVKVRDIWQQRELGNFKDTLSSRIAVHSVTMLRLTGRPGPG